LIKVDLRVVVLIFFLIIGRTISQKGKENSTKLFSLYEVLMIVNFIFLAKLGQIT
jgi:hypothetical protein